MNKIFDVRSDPPVASTLSALRQRIPRFYYLTDLRFFSGFLAAVSFCFGIVVLFFPPDVHPVNSLIFCFSFALFAFFVWLWGGKKIRDISSGGVMLEDFDLDPASPSDLALLSCFLGFQEIKTYLQKVAQQQRPLTHFEFKMLFTAAETLKQDALKKVQLSILERENQLAILALENQLAILDRETGLCANGPAPAL